ncbi:uncharacterized protein LOC121875247 [Homarus americanus]|uniref:uncharacterized protein LOC121875247 n=1 Tax=Homarus americanus TaxID=6706 RepID=UPI001C44C758|nr:uncharacterized protein LOC121875247 [Homarus americanus]
MCEVSNRDSGTSCLSEVDDVSDDDTLVGLNSDGDGVVLSGTEEGGSSRGSGEGFLRAHRRDDSGIELGSYSQEHESCRHQPDDRHQSEELDNSKRRRSSDGYPSEENENEVMRNNEIEFPRDEADNISVLSEMSNPPPEWVHVREGEEGGEPGGRIFRRSRNHQFRIGRRFTSQKMLKKMKKAVHFGKKGEDDERDVEVHHTKLLQER